MAAIPRAQPDFVSEKYCPPGLAANIVLPSKIASLSFITRPLSRTCRRTHIVARSVCAVTPNRLARYLENHFPCAFRCSVAIRRTNQSYVVGPLKVGSASGVAWRLQEPPLILSLIRSRSGSLPASRPIGDRQHMDRGHMH